MKIKQEWYAEDQKVLGNRNGHVAASLRGGSLGLAEAADARDGVAHRYVDKARTKIPDLFTPKRPKAA